MIAVRLGVDLSQGDSLTPEILQTWHDLGVTNVYVQYSSQLGEFLTALDGQGFIVDVYVYLYFPRSPWNQLPETRVDSALDMCRGHQVRYVWLDVEEPTDSDTQTGCVASLLRCGALITAAGLLPGIYSGKSTYISHTGNSTVFADLGWPLWHADYLGEALFPDLSLMPTVLVFRGGSYGGWRKPLVHQWWNTCTFGGRSVDMDVEEEEMEHFVVLGTGKVSVNPTSLSSADGELHVGFLGLPEGKNSYKIQVFNPGPEPVAFYHGGLSSDIRDAGRVYPPYGVVDRLQVDSEGFFYLEGPDQEVEISPLGYYE